MCTSVWPFAGKAASLVMASCPHTLAETLANASRPECDLVRCLWKSTQMHPYLLSFLCSKPRCVSHRGRIAFARAGTSKENSRSSRQPFPPMFFEKGNFTRCMAVSVLDCLCNNAIPFASERAETTTIALCKASTDSLTSRKLTPNTDFSTACCFTAARV